MSEKDSSYKAVKFGWEGDDFITVDTEGKTRRYVNAKVTDVARDCSIEIKDGKVIGNFSF